MSLVSRGHKHLEERLATYYRHKAILRELGPYMNQFEFIIQEAEPYSYSIWISNEGINLSISTTEWTEEEIIVRLVDPFKSYFASLKWELTTLRRTASVWKSVEYELSAHMRDRYGIRMSIRSEDSPDCQVVAYTETVTKYKITCNEEEL